MRIVPCHALSLVVFIGCLQAQRSLADSPVITGVDATTRETSASAATAAHAQPELASHPPLYLEVRATVHENPENKRGPFVPDISLHAGDDIELLVRSSIAVRVYLLHCSGDATLSVFPDAAGISFHADEWVALPAAGLPVRLGAKPGPETLYVVAAREPLARSDVALEQRLRQAMSEGGAKCDQALEAVLAGTAGAESGGQPPAAASVGMHKPRYALRGVDISKATSPVARAFAERDGIVVMRLAYLNAP